MGLLDRVSTLVRANLNDLIDRSEDPEKMLKQVILDLQNQLMQVKTQVALAMADAHQLRSKLHEHRTAEQSRLSDADLAVSAGRMDLARAAIEHAISHREMAASYARQEGEHQIQVEQLKSALRSLEMKLAETRSASELLLARRRSARASTRAAQAGAAMASDGTSEVVERMKDKVEREAAFGAALSELSSGNVAEELSALRRHAEVERILGELTNRKGGD